LGWDCRSWYNKKEKKKVLFLRSFRGYTGGHQKVYDYYQDLKSHPSFDVEIYFDPVCLWDQTNPWMGEHKHIVEHIDWERYDMLFVAGMDWEMVPLEMEQEKPVINLIQHVRHAESTHRLSKFLNRKATRIAVSSEVQEAIEATERLNGLVYTIENGIDLKTIRQEKSYDVYILGPKNPDLAEAMAQRLIELGFTVHINTDFIPKEQVYDNMASAHISLLLPNPSEGEGFYLPALEAMYYSDLCIVPDCVGNRSFCHDGENCLIPDYEIDAMIQKCQLAKELISSEEYLNIKEEALHTVGHYSSEGQREKFYQLLDEVVDV